MKSRSFLKSVGVTILSDSMSSSEPKTTIILFMTTAMVKLYSIEFGAIQKFQKTRLWSILKKFSVPSKYSTNIKLYTEILSLKIFCFMIISLKWLILGFVKGWSNRKAWRKLWWDPQSIWPLKFWKANPILPKLISGHSESSFSRCFTDTAHTSLTPSPNSQTKLSKQLSTSPKLPKFPKKQNPQSAKCSQKTIFVV